MGWKRHGLCSFNQVLRECDALLTSSGVLGMMEDGLYQCDIVRLDKTRTGYEVTVKHGSRIISQEMPRRIYADLQWATGWNRPQGGQCIIKVTNGEIDEVGKL